MRATAEIVADLRAHIWEYVASDVLSEVADRLAELEAEVAAERQARYEWSRKAVESEAAMFNQNRLRQIVGGSGEGFSAAAEGFDSPPDPDPPTPAGSDFMADQTTHAESAVGGSPTPSRALDEIDRIRAEFMAGVSEPQCWAELFGEIDHLRDLARATEESRVKWQLRALEADSLLVGLHRFALLIVSLNRTRAIDEVIDATPDAVLRYIDPDILGPDGWAETRINPDDCTPRWGT